MSKKKQTISLLVLSATAGLMYLAPFLRFSFYDQMMSALQITDIQMGTIGSIYGLFYVIAFLPSGFLSEKFDTKALLAISNIAMCLCTVWYAFYPGYKAILVIHALYGIFSVGTFWSPYLKAVRSLASEEKQGTIFGLSEGLRGVAQTIVSFACVGVLSIASSVTLGFRLTLWINAAAYALLAVAVIILLPSSKPEKDSSTSENKSHNYTVLSFLKNPSIWICIFIIMAGYCVWTTTNSYIGTYCTRILGIDANLSSVLSIIRSYIIVFVAGASGGIIIDKFRTKGQGLLVAFSLVSLSAIGILLTNNIMFVCVIVTVVLSYMVNVVKSTYWSILGDAGIPLEATGLATGIISLIGLTPDIFTPPVISRFLNHGESAGNIETGFNMMLIWLAVWGIVGIIFSFLLKKKKESLSCQSTQ